MPSQFRHFRPRIAVIALLLSGVSLVAGCGQSPDSAGESNAAEEANSGSTISLPEALPVPDPELGRAELIEAAAHAASAYAAGADDSEAQEALAGRRFTLRLRFGCGGPADTLEDASLGWTYEEADRSLKVRAAPNLIRGEAKDEEEPDDKAADGAVEAIEGFWIPRPWILTDACPAHPLKDSSAGAPPTIGIAQYFTADTSRVHRRSGRAYEVTKRVDPSAARGSQGFTLVLHGRLNAPPGGKVIQCAATGADIRPQCIISAEFDEISLRDPATGVSFGDWR